MLTKEDVIKKLKGVSNIADVISFHTVGARLYGYEQTLVAKIQLMHQSNSEEIRYYANLDGKYFRRIDPRFYAALLGLHKCNDECYIKKTDSTRV